MSDRPASEPPAPAGASRVDSSHLADGDWHRLHPATPLLRGGVALVAIAGVVVVNLRDTVIDALVGGGDRADRDSDPIRWLLGSPYLPLALLGVLVVLLLLVGGYYLSWRMRSFRVGDELVEVRSGVLSRNHRRGRLDRVQGVSIQRPLLARLFGAARLEIDVAGQDANVRLDYLSTAAADALRRDILLLASGARALELKATGQRRHDAPHRHGPPELRTVGNRRSGPGAEGAGDRGSVSAGSFVDARVSEFLAPELDPALAAPESVVAIHLGRLIGSIVLSGPMFWILLVTIAPPIVFRDAPVVALASVVPGVLGVGSFLVRRFTRSLRYTIAATPDGIRIGFGLLSTSNETLPPGRIHAIEVSQPLLWRPFGWWRVRIDRASSSRTNGAAGQANTTILPVGDRDDVRRVLALVFPEASVEAIDAGLTRGGPFVGSPPRARVLRWFSRRRNGYALAADLVLLRTGAVLRALVVVPLARVQGVSVHQDPLERMLRLASARVHTVAGPVVPRVGALDARDAEALLEAVASGAIAAASVDRAHRWRIDAGAAPLVEDRASEASPRLETPPSADDDARH
ncbi:PH domain-containing protein [Galbitalea sp. SE-J8]|uniref:PH domain-containing protein n=1 Tax=Galbitalea sp. SE-J8 TaxID=3054952 RepID=UPI00259C8A50|nr:PH domain-containing protein [Galbitalea sp. SE-J8]MDM4761644.1 PH domain-containing protein [Galbitalea sp. SE-J8]